MRRSAVSVAATISSPSWALLVALSFMAYWAASSTTQRPSVVEDAPLPLCTPPPDVTRVGCNSSTVRWGAWDASFPPVAAVANGSTVRIYSYTHYAAAVGSASVLDELEGSAYSVHSAMRDIHAAHCGPEAPGDRFRCGKPGPHLLTGPIYVEGAEPGDVLMVEIISTEPFLDWGWNRVAPGVGALKDFDASFATYGLNLSERTAQLPWGGSIPWNITGTGPFFGSIGVAPPPEMGAVSSVYPFAEYGGNIDNKHLGAGTTLYLPVNVKGALFSVGDGHAMQGDGEVCVTALETSLVGDFRLTVRKDLGARGDPTTTWVPPGAKRPKQIRAETATHWIAMAFDPDLDKAETAALEDLLEWMWQLTDHRLSRESLYRLASLAADMAVTQVVNTRKGIHILLPKAAIDFDIL